MEDNDSLYFSFDEEEEEEAAAEGQNRAFLIGAIVLAAVFVLGICAVVIIFVIGPGARGGEPEVSENQLTNEFNMTAAASTAAASQLTQQAEAPLPEETVAVPTDPTEEPIATVTPTSELDVTPLEGTPGEGTAVAEITPGEGTGTVEATPGEGTGTPEVAEVTPGATEGVATPTSLVPPGTVAPTGTSGIIEVTPLGATPVEGGMTPTGIGGPITPQPQLTPTLPSTGLVSNGGLIGVGVLAVPLVAIVVIVRRIRLQ